MTVKADPEALETIFKPLIAKHFTESELAEIGTRAEARPDDAARWQDLMAEAERLMAKGDPASPEALDLARRWKAMVKAFTGGDPALAGKVKAVWFEAFADPAAAPKLPASPAMFAFIGKALAELNASQEIR